MLQQQIDLLFRKMAGEAGQPPVADDVVIAELSKETFDVRGRPVIARDELRTIEQYEERFSELMAKGFAWINLSSFGLLDGTALVTVEFPNYERVGGRAITSVNFSGPLQAVARSTWDARPHIVLR